MRHGPLRRGTAVLSVLGAACALLALAVPAWGATGAWDRTWGKDVVSGNAATGSEICTVSALCQSGQAGDGAGEFSRPQDVAVAPNGDVYVADENNSRIEVFDGHGHFIREFGQVYAPNSIAIDGDGNVYVTQSKPHIEKYDSQGNFLLSWGRDVVKDNGYTGPEICTVESQCQGGTQTEDNGSTPAYEGGAFGYDNQVAASPGGVVYVMEDGRSRISEFDSSGHFQRLWGKDVVAGNAYTGAEICNVSADCKIGDSGTLGGELGGVGYGATDKNGNLYVAEASGTTRVDEFTPAGGFVLAFGKNVVGGNAETGFEVCTNAANCLGGDRDSTAGAFDAVTDVAVDSAGNVYTAEDQNHRIQKFTAAGAFVSTWGKGVNGGSGLETCTTLNGCSGGAFGAKGGEIDNSFPGIGADPVHGRLLYATGYEGNRVQVYGAQSPILTSTSPASPANDNGPKVTGSAQEGSTVDIYKSATCTGAPAASGTAAALASPGLTVNVADDSTTAFSATVTAGGETSDCSAALTYVEDSTPPPAPTISTTMPGSPSTEQHPKVIGSAEAGSTVRLYTDMACSGSPSASGSAATFASPGIDETVAFASTTTFYATATDAAGNVSPCSTGLTYEHVATPVNSSAPTVSGPANVRSGDTLTADPGSWSNGPTGYEYTWLRCDPAGDSCAPIAGATSNTYVVRDDDAGGTLRVAVVATHGANRSAPTRSAPTAVVTGRDLGPDTQITTAPEGPTSVAPTFGFAASVPSATFECRFDGEDFAPCKTPLTRYGLALGTHTFYVRAVAPDGSRDPTPATRAFTLAVTNVTHECSVQATWRYTVQFCTPFNLGSTATHCPVGAQCTLTSTVYARDGDDNATLFAGSNVKLLDPKTLRGPETRVSCQTDPKARDADEKVACPASVSLPVVGENQSALVDCFPAWPNRLDSDPRRGPDEQRVVHCVVTLRIEPAAPLEVVVGGSQASTQAPGPGQLTVTAPAGSKRRAVAATARAAKKRRRPRPPFAPFRATVKHAGAVTIKLKLSKPAKRTLARRHKLALRLKLSFKPAGGGKAVSKTQRVTLRKPPPGRCGRRVHIPCVPAPR